MRTRLKHVFIPQQPSLPAEDHDSVALVLASHGKKTPVSAETDLEKLRKDNRDHLRFLPRHTTKSVLIAEL